MTKYNVVYRTRGSNNVGNCTFIVDASSEYEAVEKWEQTIAGKSGRCEVIEVYRTGSR